MTKKKPDWAERLQRTFKRNYLKGVNDENVRISVRDLLTLIKKEENG